jgi:hypothetical protein
MKKNIVYIAIASLSVYLASCEEVGPAINLGNTGKSVSDTTYVESTIEAPSDKHVLLEEFTGVRCINCPDGHVIIQTLKNTYGQKVASAAFHTNDLGEPYSGATEDLRTADGEILQDYLVYQGSKPSAAIDRVKFSGGDISPMYSKGVWSKHVQTELDKTAPLNIYVTPAYDSSSRTLTFSTELHYTKAVGEQQKISVFLLETNLVEPQINASNVVDPNYVHKDVFRKAVTNIKGDPITPATEAGRVIRSTYITQLAANWKVENMRLLVFVHKYGSSEDILQVREVGL